MGWDGSDDGAGSGLAGGGLKRGDREGTAVARWRLVAACGLALVVLGNRGVPAAAAASTPTLTAVLDHSFSRDRHLACAGPAIDSAGGFGEDQGWVRNRWDQRVLVGLNFQFAWGALSGRLRLPAGATLLGGVVKGAAHLDTGPGGLVTIGLEGASPPPNPDAPTDCTIAVETEESRVTLRFAYPGQVVPFTADGYALAADMLRYPGSGPEYVLAGTDRIPGITSTTLRLAGPLQLRAEYGFTPSDLTMAAAGADDVTLGWAQDGNPAATRYRVQRQRQGGGDATPSPWATLATTHAPRLDTAAVAPQRCGVAYRYRVAAAGADAHTPWATSEWWVTAPCGLRALASTPTALEVSFASAPPGGSYTVWACPLAACGRFQVATGVRQGVRIPGLVPNTRYRVWVCAENTLACAAVDAWTPPAVPTLIAARSAGDAAPDAQPLTVEPAGNPTGTHFVVARETVSAAGVWGEPVTLTQGGGRSVTVGQVPGGSYRYLARAVGAASGLSSPWSAAVAVQVATTPRLRPTGATTAVVVWAPVPGVTATAVRCAAVGGGGWRTVGETAGDQLPLVGLRPATGYTCAIAAWATNAGVRWWQESPVAETAAAAPVAVSWTPAGAEPWNVVVRWDHGGNPFGVVYEVQARQLGTGAPRSWRTLAVTTARSIPSSRAGCGQAFVYRVRAANAAGWTTPWVQTAPQVNAPCSLRSVVLGPTSLRLTWTPAAPQAAGVAYTLWWRLAGGTVGNRVLSPEATGARLAGLVPNGAYQVWLTGNDGWPDQGLAAQTPAVPPQNVVVAAAGQTSLSLRWDAAGNAAPTAYQVALRPCGGSRCATLTDTTSATAWRATGLTPGTRYEIRVRAGPGREGPWSAWTDGPNTMTIPAAPRVRASVGGWGWEPSGGRGYVRLSWGAVTGASGYRVWVFDGLTMEALDVGDVLSWDSRVAAISPPSASLYPRVAAGTGRAPLFHSAGGQLPDRPRDLYCTLVPLGQEPCGPVPLTAYRFAVSALDASGDSAGSEPCGHGACRSLTLPLQTDPEPPLITRFELAGGGQDTYGRQVDYRLQASESPAGVAAWALSNDDEHWVTHRVSGCAPHGVRACPQNLTATGPWSLTFGPGTKVVWVRAESTAGVWSAPLDATIYLQPDATVPTVDVTLDGGAPLTKIPEAVVRVTVTDPVTAHTALTWRARYSANGGQTWSPWTDEGSATVWTVPWPLPAGAAGTRTVLVQAENADGNLGQGMATIRYAPPQQAPTIGGATATACRARMDGAWLPAECVRTDVVTLALTPPAGAVRFRLSRDDITWGPWQGLAASWPVALQDTPGIQAVWLQYQGSDGQVQSAPPALYVYEPSGPALRVDWVGHASATDLSGLATLAVDVREPGGTEGLRLTVQENGRVLYVGPPIALLPLRLTGSGYQIVQVTAGDPAGNRTTVDRGIYVRP